MLALASALAYRLWGQQLLTATMVPTAPFTEPRTLDAADYEERRDLWFARPDIVKGNPALWTPPGVAREGAGRAAIFFVHPTSYFASFNSARWNMRLDDREALAQAAQFLRGQASAFNAAGGIWAPKYRQAHFGAFLTDIPAGKRALDAAYRDIAAAFAAFLAQNPEGPIVLAGHSQGSLHLMRLLHETIAGTPVARRVAAVYLAGWPVSIEADLPALGLPGCTRRSEAGCVLSWQSFAEPADPSAISEAYDRGPGLTGKPRRGTKMLCVNPLTGTPDSAAAASRNLGTLVLADVPGQSRMVPGAVPARCDAHGFLMIGAPPALGPLVLPGNNYHVYDYGLFWADIRRDVSERLASFVAPAP